MFTQPRSCFLKMSFRDVAEVLEVLLLIGGVEPNPGPTDMGNCELCGTHLGEMVRSVKNTETAVSVKEKELQRRREELADLERDLALKSKLVEKKLQMVTDRETHLINREKLMTEREQLHVQTEKAFLKTALGNCDCRSDCPNKKTQPNATPEGLLKAIKDGKWWDVRAILQTKKVSAEHRFDDRKTPLLIAAENGQLSVVQYFIETAGACVNAADNLKGRSALHWACSGGHLDVVKYLVTEANLEASKTTSALETPLHVAAKGGFLDVIKFLTETAGASIHDRDVMGMTAAHFAAKHGQLHVVEYLWEHSKTPFGNTNDGWTALHFACEAAHLDVVMYLVRSGAADKNTLNRAGYKAVAYVPKVHTAIRTFLA